MTNILQVAGQCSATAAPPNELIQSWIGPRAASTALSKVPRGRSGPGHSSPEVPASTDATTLLLTTMVPVMAMVAQNMNSAIRRSSRQKSPPSSPPSSPPRNSSPPPPIADELQIFLEAFGRAKGIATDIISDVYERLNAVHYSPDAVSEISLSSTRLQELTGLAEGQVYSLCKFSREWCGKVDAKRAKLRRR